MTNSFNNLLITLTIFDTTFIVFMLFDYTSFRGNSSRYHQLSLTQTFHVQINFTFHFPLSLLSFFILQFGSGPSTTRQLCMLTSSPRFMSHLIFISYISYFSKFLFPLNNIALSCSIYSTVGIAYERLDKKIHNCSFT